MSGLSAATNFGLRFGTLCLDEQGLPETVAWTPCVSVPVQGSQSRNTAQACSTSSSMLRKTPCSFSLQTGPELQEMLMLRLLMLADLASATADHLADISQFFTWLRQTHTRTQL